MITRTKICNFDEWRINARQALQSEILPNDIEFVDGLQAEQGSLFADILPASLTNALPRSNPTKVLSISRRFMELAKFVACHRDPSRYDLLYRAIWRYLHGEPHVLDLATDDDVYRLSQMEKSVRRAAHKTKAFVRFRLLEIDDEPRYIAWHQPEHRILPLVAPFFARRFPAMHWTIMTPDETVSWDQHALTFAAGVPASRAPQADDVEELWKAYYASIFNPARIKLKAMKREMPVRHWPTLPETALIPDLLADAPRRVAEMVARGSMEAVSAERFLPLKRDLQSLSTAAVHCQGCAVHQRATQVVFGEGFSTAELMLVGEQPGDQEDLRGRPFIGPAGKILEEALTQAGLTRAEVYLTNAVKHFHWKPSGKKRLHQKPPSRALAACRPWLDAERQAVAPKVLVCLGATAAQAIAGYDGRRLKTRGEFFRSAACEKTIITWHPAAILRVPDVAEQQRRREELSRHLQAASHACSESSSPQ